MPRRPAWLPVALVASLLVIAGLAGPSAGAETPAPGTVLAAQRLIRFDSRTQAEVLVASFRVQGYPGDTADGLLQVGWADSSYFPHSKAVPAPCASAAPTCSDVWEITLDGFARGPFRSPGVQQARLTLHDAAGRQHRVELGDVVVQHLAAASSSMAARPAPLETGRRVGRCARVRAVARGLRAGAVRLTARVGCHPRQSRARIQLSVPAVVPPAGAYALLGTPTRVRLTHIRPRGRVRVSTLVVGVDTAWRRCVAPTDRRATTVVCGGYGSGPTLVRVAVARGARVDVSRVTGSVHYTQWVS